MPSRCLARFGVIAVTVTQASPPMRYVCIGCEQTANNRFRENLRRLCNRPGFNRVV